MTRPLAEAVAGRCTAVCNARQAAGGRCLSVYPSGAMRSLAPLSALLVLLAFAAPAAAQQPEQRIRPGVKAGGLDVGGLTVPEAAVKLQQTYGPALYNPISVQVAGRRFRLTPNQSGLKFDTVLTAKRAYHAGQANPAVDIALATSLDKARVRTFARGVAKEVYLAPRDATIRITLRHIFRRKSRTGRSLDVKALRAAIKLTLSNATAPHVIRPPRQILKAKVTADKLARSYPCLLYTSPSPRDRS